MQIKLNTLSVTSQFGMTQRDVESFIDYVVKDIAASYVRKWEGLAKKQLKTSRQIYISSLKVIDVGRMKGAVLLDYTQHPLVKMLEEGANAFDIKKGFEKSPKRHITSTGWYMSIPFRVGVPTTIGEANIFSVKSMPMAVYKQAKNLQIPESKNTSKGLSLKNIPSPFNQSGSRSALTVIQTNETFDEYKHKTSIYTGIVKKQDSVTGQNKYMSFRRVSNLSDPMAFIHSGILAYNLADKAMDLLKSNMHNELTVATDNALDKLGF